jgi:hypothetical protein
VAVAVVPGVLVVVAQAARGQPLERGGQVAAQAGLELDGGDRARRARHEHQHLAVVQVVALDQGLQVGREVAHVVVAARLDVEVLRDPHPCAILPPASAPVKPPTPKEGPGMDPG